MSGAKITIKGVGAFIAVKGSDSPRPIGHGQTVTVDQDLADRLVADGVAVHGDSLPTEPAPTSLAEAQGTPTPSGPPPASSPPLSFDVAEGTIDAVMAWVGDDQARREYALAAEQARDDEARKSLVERLQPAAITNTSA